MAGRPRVLYTDPPWLVAEGGTDPGLATVEAAVLGPEVALDFGPYDGGRYLLDHPRLYQQARGAAVLVVYRQRAGEALLAAAGPGLRAVIRQGVGVDNIDAAALQHAGVPGYHVPDYCVDEVSTHATALALALERGVVAQHTGLTGGHFDIYAGGVPRRLSTRTLGIVGFGRIGRAVARKLGAHYGQVLVYDPYLGPDLAQGYGARATEDLAELLRGADLVSLHCPLTEHTARMINAATLSQMRADAFLVNTARGALVDPAALAEALHGGRLAGAALDVFHPENPHDDPAWAGVLAHPRVLVTSHRAFLSADAEASLRERVARLIRDLLAGTTPAVGRIGTSS